MVAESFLSFKNSIMRKGMRMSFFTAYDCQKVENDCVRKWFNKKEARRVSIKYYYVVHHPQGKDTSSILMRN